MDECLWERLNQADPELICRNCEISFDSMEKAYHVPVLNELFAISPEGQRVVALNQEGSFGRRNQVDLTLFLLHYLLGAKNIPLLGIRVSEKELRGGEMFFRGPHALPIKGIVAKFGTNPEAFIDAGLRLGGRAIALGDAAIELKVAPKVPVTYVLWAKDEEFAASVSVLFDPTIQEFLPLDIIYGVAIITHLQLAEA